MKPIMVLGIIFVIVGAIALGYHGITYTTHQKVFQIGPIEATKKTEKTIPLSPVLGGAALAAGSCSSLWEPGSEPLAHTGAFLRTGWKESARRKEIGREKGQMAPAGAKTMAARETMTYEKSKQMNVAIAGLGNCAASLPIESLQP